MVKNKAGNAKNKKLVVCPECGSALQSENYSRHMERVRKARTGCSPHDFHYGAIIAVAVVLVLAISGLWLYGFVGKAPSQQENSQQEKVSSGASATRGSSGIRAADFSLKDLNGNVFRLSDFRGRVVLLDFMATWCGPCRAVMPGLRTMQNAYRGRVTIISISVDPVFDTDEKLRGWVNEWGATWMHAQDATSPPVRQLYRITAIPTYVIIDKEGYVRYTHEGLIPTETIDRELSTVLAG